jgi:HPt (histidine-containing phosphotransfer) domain-containing protein
MLDPNAVKSLIELVGDDAEALSEIVDAFLDEAPQRLTELRRGIDDGDSVLVGRAAHTLKANARTFGAGRLAELSGVIESAARGGDLAPAAAHVDALDEEWRTVQPAVRSLVVGDSP